MSDRIDLDELERLALAVRAKNQSVKRGHPKYMSSLTSAEEHALTEGVLALIARVRELESDIARKKTLRAEARTAESDAISENLRLECIAVLLHYALADGVEQLERHAADASYQRETLKVSSEHGIASDASAYYEWKSRETALTERVRELEAGLVEALACYDEKCTGCSNTSPCLCPAGRHLDDCLELRIAALRKLCEP